MQDFIIQMVIFFTAFIIGSLITRFFIFIIKFIRFVQYRRSTSLYKYNKLVKYDCSHTRNRSIFTIDKDNPNKYKTFHSKNFWNDI